MLDIEQVKINIDHWIKIFLEVPNPALGGWAPCPYARRARLDQAYRVQLGDNILFDLMDLGRTGLGGLDVVVLAYDPELYAGVDFELAVHLANREYLVPRRLIALPDHPARPESVNGVIMNQGTYALILVQDLDDLDSRAAAVGKAGFYDTWPEAYLLDLFQHRQDPRS